MSYQPIANYGVVGNLQTVALVGMNGSIDFLSFPYFDSPTVFAALLDDQKGGRFSISPTQDGAQQKQLYLVDSNILLTRFLAPEGVAEISDFMPLSICPSEMGDERDNPTRLVRRVKVVRGEMRCRLLCAPRFDYARSAHRLEQTGDREIIFAEEGDGKLVLRLRSLDVPLRRQDGDATAEFTLRAGQHATFVLEEVRGRGDDAVATHEAVVASFKETLNFWRDWVAKSTYKGRWREIVNRSALTLKMMTSQKYGSVVAAPTCGLPEAIGHGRNWDYRFTWIRDASFTVYALNRLGYNDEAGAFMRWIEKRCAEMHPDKGLQIMYGIDGRAELPEIELDNLDGYMGSRPVRIGNAASDQLQLDIYGELMDSVYLYDKYARPLDYDGWLDVTKLINYVCKNYEQPDAGIWEVRGGKKEYLYSRLMSWVAVDRAIRLSNKRSFPTPPAHWFKTRD
ncbi:MAG: glycoside hydrolase family 15 protein, partial [Gluconacetobacter diazotrophicus]|nr:glycoside hydrolase family 15 protein [Gluconacetobacter diazotrophicus]